MTRIGSWVPFFGSPGTWAKPSINLRPLSHFIINYYFWCMQKVSDRNPRRNLKSGVGGLSRHCGEATLLQFALPLQITIAAAEATISSRRRDHQAPVMAQLKKRKLPFLPVVSPKTLASQVMAALTSSKYIQWMISI